MHAIKEMLIILIILVLAGVVGWFWLGRAKKDNPELDPQRYRGYLIGQLEQNLRQIDSINKDVEDVGTLDDLRNKVLVGRDLVDDSKLIVEQLQMLEQSKAGQAAGEIRTIGRSVANLFRIITSSN